MLNYKQNIGFLAGLNRRSRTILFSFLLLAAALLPILTSNQYYLHIAVVFMVYIMLSLGLNVIISCGLLNLGYIAFFAIGAYSYAILNTKWHVSFWPVLPLAIGLCFLAGAILAIVSLRSRSDYFALVTLAFGVIVHLVIRNSDSLTNGPQGIGHIDTPSFIWPIESPTQFYYFGLVLLVIIFFIVHRVTISRLGAAWIASRENVIWTLSVGYNVLAVRISACVLGAIVAGVSGVFFASWQTFVAPESFILLESILVLCMVILGGGVRGNLIGVLVGAIILALLPELFRGFAAYRMMALGAGMLLIALFKSSGIVGRSWLEDSDRKLFDAKLGNKGDHAQVRDNYQEHMNSSLKIKNLRKSFDGVVALGNRGESQQEREKGFSFVFQKGTIYGIIGLNGAGKTTLFNCVRGFCCPDSGEIRIDKDVLFSNSQSTIGNSTGKSHCHEKIDNWLVRISLALRPCRLSTHRVARFLGTTFQTCSNQENIPAWKNVYLALRPLDGTIGVFRELLWSIFRSIRPVDIMDKELAVRFLVESIGFPESELETTVQELSFANRRKVELAKAFAPGNPIILLDEPTAGLNEVERREFVGIIKRLAKGKTVVVIEHNYTVLEQLADEVLFMEHGNLGIEDGKPIVASYKDIMANSHVRETYLGKLTSQKVSAPSLPSSEPILEASINGAGYIDGASVIKDVKLTMPKGSIVGIAGLNGAGKTTLLRCLINSAEIRWLNGTVYMQRQGARIWLVGPSRKHTLPSYRIAREGVVLVRQEQKLFGTMSVVENLRFGSLWWSRQRAQHADSIIRDFYEDIFAHAFPKDISMQDAFARKASHLSGGQQQLLAIGRALVAASVESGSNSKANNDKLLLLDEPTSGLQPTLAKLIFKTIESLRSNFGFTILITEQGMELNKISDLVLRMENGRLLGG